MTDAPERIWAYSPDKGQHAVYKPASKSTEYTRTDIADAAARKAYELARAEAAKSGAHIVRYDVAMGRK